MSSEWFVEGQRRNFPLVAFPARLYWPSRPDGFNMRMLVDANFGKVRAPGAIAAPRTIAALRDAGVRGATAGQFRIFTFAGAKDKSYEDAGYRLIPFGYAEEFVRPMDLDNLSPWQVRARACRLWSHCWWDF